MNIKYLNIIKDYPTFTYKLAGIQVTCQGLSEAEIRRLEIKYNNGNAFPLVVKEFLYLAGKENYFFDANGGAEHFHDGVLSEMSRMGLTFNRPILITSNYGVGNGFEFVYLDEADDPIVKVTTGHTKNFQWANSNIVDLPWDDEYTNVRLSECIKDYVLGRQEKNSK
ncbi:MAG: hypothetical protein H6607_07540 [Flavobacteriales bacterium]|nr:hypothetical protein [Flavobacteriales bacterium]